MWKSLSIHHSVPYLPLAHMSLYSSVSGMCCSGISIRHIPATHSTIKGKVSAVWAPKPGILPDAVKMEISGWPQGLNSVTGKEHFHPISVLLWSGVWTVVTAGKLLAGISQAETEQLTFCSEIQTSLQSPQSQDRASSVCRGESHLFTLSMKKPNRAKSRSPAGDY